MILALIPAGLYAQSGLDDFFANYSKTQGYQTIIYGKRMLEMMKEVPSGQDKDHTYRQLRSLCCPDNVSGKEEDHQRQEQI